MQVRQRYLALNAHAASYTWKALGRKGRHQVASQVASRTATSLTALHIGARCTPQGLYLEPGGCVSPLGALAPCAAIGYSAPTTQTLLCSRYNLLCVVLLGAGGNSTWEFKELDLNHTLLENGIVEESELFESLDMASDAYVPVLHVYWNDDLTVA